MLDQGIYTLANDVVYDQLVALLNSIEVNISPDIPVCVIPYDDRLEKVTAEIRSRDNVTLFDNWSVIRRWDDFVRRLWEAHPQAKASKLNRPRWYQGYVHRKFASFNSNFEKFVFFDADSLAMKSTDDIFEKLNDYDFVFDDWEHKKAREVTEINLELIGEKTQMSEDEIRSKIHCDSFFGSTKAWFGADQLEELEKRAIASGEINWIRDRSWWSSSGLFCYLTLALNPAPSMFNFTQSSNEQERTGNCADADPFVTIDNILYNQDGLKPIRRIHYMNYSSADFARLCRGEDVDIRYKNVFLHYRFLKQPELKKQPLKAPAVGTKIRRKVDQFNAKVKRIFVD